MRAVRLLYNHTVMFFFPIIGPYLAISSKGWRNMEGFKDSLFFFAVCFGMPIVQVLTIIAWMIGKFINNFTPFVALGFLGIKKDDEESKFILIFVNNCFFRGVQWIEEIKTHPRDYKVLKSEMREILDRCCRPY